MSRMRIIFVTVIVAVVAATAFFRFGKQYFYPDRPVPSLLLCSVDRSTAENRRCNELCGSNYPSLGPSSMTNPDTKATELFCCPTGYRLKTERYPPTCVRTGG